MAEEFRGMKNVELGDLSFVSTDTTQNDMYGQMETGEQRDTRQSSSEPGTFGGLTSNLLNKRGFGWLLEVEEIDEDAFDKPLLYVSIYLHVS